MERSDKNKPLWRKITTGKLYPFPNQRGRRIKPQEQIRASREELAHVLDHFELIENGKGEYRIKKTDLEQKDITPPIPDKEEYSVKSCGGGWYNVHSPSGEVMNEKALRVEDAETLKKSLEEETEQA